MHFYANYQTPTLGKLILATDESALIGAWFEGQKFFGFPYKDELAQFELDQSKLGQSELCQSKFDQSELDSPSFVLPADSNNRPLAQATASNSRLFIQEADSYNQPLTQAVTWLDAYFAGEKPSSKDLPINPKGTAFQKLVWNELLKIPYGKTTTYGQIAAKLAQQLGKPRMSAQAVGGAVGRNPISIIVPCHRVLGANGALTGYAGGVERKKWLLAHEGMGF